MFGIQGGRSAFVYTNLTYRQFKLPIASERGRGLEYLIILCVSLSFPRLHLQRNRSQPTPQSPLIPNATRELAATKFGHKFNLWR